MPETSELRIFESDPKRVVSVTVGELQEIVRSHPKTAHQCHTLVETAYACLCVGLVSLERTNLLLRKAGERE